MLGARRQTPLRLRTMSENTNSGMPAASARKTSEDTDPEILAPGANSSANPPTRTPEGLLALDKAKGMECLKVMRSYMATCWWFVQPLLFTLIGADIPVEKLRADTIGKFLGAILHGICWMWASFVHGFK